MMQTITKTDQMIRIGVLSDTHVPDRVGELHPDVISVMKSLQVDHILHAGDISSQVVLDQLEIIAPCTSVKGNRDWFKNNQAQFVKFISFNNVKICINHGHGTLFYYLADKIPYFINGYSFERYQKNLEKFCEDALVIVFGHTHQVENRWVNKRLFFNSGSAYDSGNDGSGPTIGLIEIFPDQSVKGSIIPMRKAKWTKTGWIINEKPS